MTRKPFILFAFLILPFASAWADSIVSPRGVTAETYGDGDGSVTFIGEPTSKIEKAKGESSDERLARSLKKLAPKGWRGSLVHNGEVDSTCKISWVGGGDDWTDVLGESLVGTGLVAYVNWATKRVTLKSASNGSCVNLDNPIEINENEGDWTIYGGQTLSAGLKKAAASHGWRLEWLLPYDFMLDDDLSLNGTVKDVVDNLVVMYQDMGEMDGVAPNILYEKKVIEFIKSPVSTRVEILSTIDEDGNVTPAIAERTSSYSRDYTYIP